MGGWDAGKARQGVAKVRTVRFNSRYDDDDDDYEGAVPYGTVVIVGLVITLQHARATERRRKK